jgi:osmoprotectant transport system ATP-binding protein
VHRREAQLRSSGAAAIRLSHVRKHFPGAATPAVGDLSLDVPEGEVVVLVGPSGCGKTTILKMVNRLVEPTGGEIEVLGTEIRSSAAPVLRRQIGYVIQQIGLFPHRTIEANIATVPRLLGWDKRRIRERVGELVELVGLDPTMLARYPSELSGGQQQRVGVARALAADPPILLMDEPYSAVDPVVRARLQDELLALQRRLRKTIVLVTHDIGEAIKLGDRVAILDVGGVLEQYAPPADLLRSPANDFVARFLGQERGLKLLSLVTVGQVASIEGPVVERDVTPAEAEAVMQKYGVDWVGVRDDGRLLGWVADRDLHGLRRVGDASTLPFGAALPPDTTLREALDVLINHRTRVAVLVDADHRYLGMLTIDQIAEGLR